MTSQGRNFKDIRRAAAFRLVEIIRDERGALTVIYGVLLLTMLVALGTGMDLSNALQAKTQLDLAADAAAISCGESWQNTMTAGAAAATTPTEFTQLQTNANTIAQAAGNTAFLAQASTLGSIVTTATNSLTSTSNGLANAKGASVACTVSYAASNPNYLMKLIGFYSIGMVGTSTAQVELAPYASVYLILDTSASMMVGSTPADQALVANWVAQNDTGPSNCLVYVNCNNYPLTPDRVNKQGQNPNNKGVGEYANLAVAPQGDVGPCAFACHDVALNTAEPVSYMQQGQTAAHTAGATTRFDVTKQALVNDPVTQSNSFCGGTGEIACVHTGDIAYEGLLPYLRDTYTVPNARANLNTFTYNMYGFNYGINGDEPSSALFQQDQTDYSQYSVASQSSLANVAAAVNKLTIGLTTHLNTPVNTGHTAVLPALQKLVIGTAAPTPCPIPPNSPPGTTNPPPGACTSNPLKFVIIMTDGLNSDRNWNYGGSPNADPPPSSGMSHPTAIPNATFCAMWTAPTPTSTSIPVVDGTPLWQGTGVGGDLGNTGQCNNNAYLPGFFSSASPPATPPAESSLTNYNGGVPANNLPCLPVITSVPPYHTETITCKNGTVTHYTDTDTYDFTGGNETYYAGPIQTSYCTTMKDNWGESGNGALPSVVIAVLETPYVPLTGQDPQYYPYEGTVQPVIWPLGNPNTHTASYPTGPNGTPMSAISQALQSCATSSAYYFQATDDAAIASGFITLFNTYVGQWVHLTQ